MVRAVWLEGRQAKECMCRKSEKATIRGVDDEVGIAMSIPENITIIVLRLPTHSDKRQTSN